MNWISAEQVLKRWDAIPRVLRDAIDAGLPVYEEGSGGPLIVTRDNFIKAFDKNPIYFSREWFMDVLFKREDIQKFETERGYGPIQTLDGKERTQFGQLLREKEKWDISIEAALEIGRSLKPGKRIKRDEFEDKIFTEFRDLPSTTIKLIWDKIPPKFKFVGRPPKKKKK